MKITRSQLRSLIKEELSYLKIKENTQGEASDNEFAKQMAVIIALEMINSTRKARRAAQKARISRMADLYDGMKLLRTRQVPGGGTGLTYSIDLGDQDLRDAWSDSFKKFDRSSLDKKMRGHDWTGRYDVGSYGGGEGTNIQIEIIDRQAE